MAKEYSPFTPGVPVKPDSFVGREKEVRLLLRRVQAARRGRIETAFLTGERGIGKSSLASFLRELVETQHQMIGVHVFLGGITELDDMVKRVFERMLRDSLAQPWHERLLEFFGKHVRKVGLFGITLELTAGKKELRDLTVGFGDALQDLLARLDDRVEGMLLLLDDINGLVQSPQFANWLKTTVDEISTRKKPLPICLVLVGLPERRTALVTAQPSLARILLPVGLKAWSETETTEFFAGAFRRVEAKLEPDACNLLVKYSGGLPMLAHEVGDATLWVDSDNVIDSNDAANGVKQAAEVIGRKHLEPQVYAAIGSQRYRSILRGLAKLPIGQPLRRSVLRKAMNDRERRVLDNFFTRMKKLGVLIPDVESGRGAYRFANLLYHVYVTLEAERASRE